MRYFLLLFLIALTVFAQAQTRRISGTILTDSVAVPGINVVIKGTATGTSTNLDGYYVLDVPADPTTIIVFSFIGFETKEVVLGAQTEISLNLLPDYKQLEEVVVTGYRSEIRADIIGSVSIVSAEKFKDMPVIGMDQALQGQAAGVQVTQSSGTPGGGISVRVRGSTSISASNRPLFIVDGVPVEDGALALRSFGGQNDNALSTLNPNDIQSITVLKDASAKALYGSRAANGVILVTTKRGQQGRTQISFDAQRGIVDVTRKVDMLNSSELLELQREAVENAGLNPNALGLIPGVTDAVDTDWLDEVLRVGILEQYQLSLRGGTEQTKVYMSTSWRDEEGVQLNNRFKRFTGTLNVDHSISQKLQLSTNLSISKVRNDRVKGDNFLDGVYSGAIKSLPYYTPFDEQGRLIGPGSGLYAGFPNFNPVAQALLPRFESHAFKLLGGVSVNYRIDEKTIFTSRVSVDYNNVFEDQFESSNTAIGGFLPSVGGQGYGIYSTGIYTTLLQNNTIAHSRQWGKHSLQGIAGTEVIYQKQRFSFLQGRLFPSDDFTYITSAGIVDAGSSDFDQNGLLSVFADAKYHFDDKYLASFSLRGDASSRFGSGKRLGIFPALSAGWRISSEPFMDAYKFIDDLKLKGGIGYTGNERIGNFGFLGLWSASTYSGATGIAPASVGNEFLQWESTREINLGVDFSFFQGRLQGSLEGYSNLTSDLLLARQLPFTTGFGNVTGNIGNVSNKGVELTLTTVNIDNSLIKWTSTLNLSHNNNKVIALSDTLPIYRGYSASGVSATNIVKEGEPLGSFWGLEFMGVDPATGDALYRDLNNDGRISDADAMIIGNTQPALIGGITQNLNYRNFDLSLFFQFSYGNDILNFSNTTLLNSGEDIFNNQAKKALDRWQEPGDITSVPRYELENTFNNLHSSRFIEDGSYLRLKNLTIGYNVPAVLLSRYRVSNLRVYMSGTNLLTLTRYTGGDPEVSTLDGSITASGIDFFTLPQVKTVLLGIKIGL